MDGIFIPGMLAASVESGSAAAKTAIVDGLKTVTTDMIGTITDMLPFIIAVIGTVTVVMFGVKIFKRFTGKA